MIRPQYLAGRTCLAAQAQAAASGGMPLHADPLGLPAAGVNIQDFQKAMLEFARVSEALARRGTTCLPCSLAQCCRVCGRRRGLDLDQWIQRSIAIGFPNSLPIARVHVPHAGSNTLERATEQLPNSLWG
ncbi:hypothetical protein MHU86_13746 [Fragilaria crotonensis]|nr:hypothetical protein MHU86_13746 [Fragilaria crotonensis]